MKSNICLRIFGFSFVLLLLSGVSCKRNAASSEPVQTGSAEQINPEYLTRAVQMLDSIYKYFYLNDQGLFNENFPKLSGDNQVSWLWPYVCLSAGANSLLEAGVQDERLVQIVDGFEKYFDTTGIPAYASYPASFGSDVKYYDDNAITGIELVSAYELTGNEKYLFQARQAMHFIFTGESGECGGGVYWNETEYGKKGEKGISANGFGTYLALKLYHITKEEQYLVFAKRIYAWVVENLKDPVSQIYWNGILPEDCSVRKDIWVYNTGIMILNGLMFYEITAEQEYLDEARKVAEASFTAFTEEKDGRRTFIHDLPWFKTVLLKSYIELAEKDSTADKYVMLFARDIDFAWENKRNDFGFVSDNWNGDKTGGEGSLLNQSCIIEIYARLAKYKSL